MSAADPRVDWEAVEQSPEFRELIAARRRFVLPATIFFLSWYIGFILLAGYAPDFMARSVYEGLTVGYCLALTQFVMVFALGLMYLRRSERMYDPLAEQGRRARAGRSRAPRRPSAGGDRAMTIAATNVEALVIFAIVLSITLVITYWASKRMTGADVFWAAGRSISGVQNGLAISGDYLSAASFLGIAGLIFIFGFDGFLYSVGFLVAFLTVMFLLAERMRNAGKYTIADVLSFRLRERPARTAAAMGTLTVAAFYLIAQMVGAGVLVQALVGIDFSIAVLITGVMMLCYVIFGGMLATTWVQIIKAVLLMTAIARDVAVRARARRLQPDRAVQPRGGEHDRRVDVLARAGHVPVEPDRHRVARASRSCSGPPACRTSSCASSRCPTRRRRARRSSGRCSSSAASTS